MGKRKQKVQWSILDGIQWNIGTTATSSEEVHNDLMEKTEEENESYLSERTKASRIPRFEQKQKHNSCRPEDTYTESKLCQIIDCQGGFTKIKSKNLDLLFKCQHDQDPANTQWQRDSSEELNSVVGSRNASSLEDITKLKSNNIPSASNYDGQEYDYSSACEVVTEVDHAGVESTIWAGDRIDEIPEFTPRYFKYETDYSLSHGYYKNYQPVFHINPNLYLYSHSSRTFTLCEEVVIPSPIHCNLNENETYFAYPVQANDWTVQIQVQPFSPPSYTITSPSSSLDFSSFYSSESCYSGSSTFPNSRLDFHSEPISPVLEHCQSKNLDAAADIIKDFIDLTQETCAAEHSTEKLLPMSVSSNSDTLPIVPNVMDTYIPGLLQLQKGKKSRKKRRKRSKYPSSSCSDSVHSSGVEQHRSLQEEVSIEQQVFESDVFVENYREINLTDETETAGNLVIHPTEPEVADLNQIEKNESMHEKVNDLESVEITVVDKESNYKTSSKIFGNTPNFIQKNSDSIPTDHEDPFGFKEVELEMKPSYRTILKDSIKESFEKPSVQVKSQLPKTEVEMEVATRNTQSLKDVCKEATPNESGSISTLSELVQVKEASTHAICPVQDNEVLSGTKVENEHEKIKWKRKRGGKAKGNTNHRCVFVRDDQVEILSKNKVEAYKYADIILVKSLGSGVTRGYMDLGRVLVGKYSPPARTDGFLHCKE